MLDTTELVHSLTSPPALSPDTPTASANLPVTSDLINTIDPNRRLFVQDDDEIIDPDGWDEADLLHREDTIPYDDEELEKFIM